MNLLFTEHPRVCFIHVPKCAGGALHHALAGHYGLFDRSRLSSRWSRRLAALRGEPLHAFRERVLVKRLETQRLRYVSGHFAISLELIERYQRQWRFLTVLRHPVDRWFSNYFFNRYKKSKHFAIKTELSHYARSTAGKKSARAYLKLFGGHGPGADRDACLDRARRTLDRFSIVGTVEHTPELLLRLREELGISITLAQRNENPLPVAHQQRHITPEIRAWVERECADDLLVYRHALQLSGVPESSTR